MVIHDFSVAPIAQQPLHENVSSKIKAVDVTTNSATLTWNSDGLFNNYKIYQYDFILKAWTEYDLVRVNEIKLENLVPSMFYKFKIVVPTANALRENLVGHISFYTCPEASTLSLQAYSATSATIAWQSEKEPFSYEIYRKAEKDDDFTCIAEVDGSQTVFEDNDVTPKTHYEYKIKNVVQNAEDKRKSKFSDSVALKTGKTMKLPKVSGKCKTYAYYTAVTDKTSPAYAVLNSGTYRGVTYETYTDEETGIRMVDDCYCAALGTYYGTVKGTKYKITLDSGESFKIILCDTKSNRHTDKKHQYAKKNKDIVEFYVDKDKIPENVNGNYNRLEQFHGAIKSIEKIKELKTEIQ